MELQLLPPSMLLFPSYQNLVLEMQANGDKVWEGYLPSHGQTPQQFVEKILGKEVHAESGMVTETTYWAAKDGIVYGRISLRHYLNDALKEFGGHIGYEVRPSARRQGIATAMLKKLLATPKAREIGRLLLTSAPTNQASVKTILNNGGVLERSAYVPKWNRETNYYWIDLNR